MKIKKSASGSTISTTGATKSGAGNKTPLKSVDPVEGVKHTSFLDELTSVQLDDIKKSLKELIEEIDEVASELSKAASMDVFIKYKNLVRQFIKDVQDKLYKVIENPSVKFLENNKVFIIVKKLDEKLEEFTRQMMSKQVDKLEIVRRVDEIRGLLMDTIV